MSFGGGHQVALDEQSAAWTDHPERTPGHPQFAVRSGGGQLDCELAADPPNVSVELERDRLVARGQSAAHVQRAVSQYYRVGNEPHLRVLLGVEEIGSAQVPIALGISRLDAGGVKRQLDCRVDAQIEPPTVIVEMAADRCQA